MSKVDVSIIMPVFNTGEYLEQAISSVLGQIATSKYDMPVYELLIVDDHSTDLLTLDILGRISSFKNLRVLKNYRKKGASGARNSGILEAKGDWIAFLDSDDWYLPNSLASRWAFIKSHLEADWVAAHFYLHTVDFGLQKDALSKRSPTLYSMIKADYEIRIPSRVEKPVALFAKYCAVGIHTVMLRRNLIIRKGMFDESLARAEDYQLWFKCAVDTDLWYVPEDVAVYRLRPGSLTHRREPKYFLEHQMLEALITMPEFLPHADLLNERINFVFNDYCYFYRRESMYLKALGWAFKWLMRQPANVSAWKQLLATVIRR